MNYYEVRFIKGGKAVGKPYTFGYDGEFKVGDRVDLPNGHGEIVAITPQEVLSGMEQEKIKKIVRITEEEDERRN